MEDTYRGQQEQWLPLSTMYFFAQSFSISFLSSTYFISIHYSSTDHSCQFYLNLNHRRTSAQLLMYVPWNRVINNWHVSFSGFIISNCYNGFSPPQSLLTIFFLGSKTDDLNNKHIVNGMTQPLEYSLEYVQRFCWVFVLFELYFCCECCVYP